MYHLEVKKELIVCVYIHTQTLTMQRIYSYIRCSQYADMLHGILDVVYTQYAVEKLTTQI